MITSILGIGVLAKIVAALGGISGTLGGLAAFGWLGPAGPVVIAGFNLIWTGIKWLAEAVQLTLTHPVILTLLVASLLYGARLGVKWDAHEVQVARLELANLKDSIREANDADDKKAAEAIKARDAAEAKLAAFMLSISPLTTSSAATASNAVKPSGLRPGAKNRGAAPCTSVFCF